MPTIHRRCTAAFIPIGVLVLTIIVVYWNRAYTSDDVGQQLILRTFHIGHTAYVGEDTFVLHLPLYWVVHALFGSSRQAVFVEALVLDVVALGFLALAAGRLVAAFGGRGSRAGLGILLGVTWFASFGGIVGDLLARPNFRTVDVAIALLLAAELVIAGAGGRLPPRRLVLLVVALSVVALDDPYALWAVVVPAVVAGAVLRPSAGGAPTRWRRSLGVVVVGALGYKVLAVVLAAIGLHSTTAGIDLTPLGDAWSALRATVAALRDYLHDASGLPDDWNWARATARLVGVVVAVGLPVRLALAARADRRLLGVLAALPLAAAAVYLVTDPTGRPGTERYLFAAFPALALCLAVGLALEATALRRAGAGLVAAAIGVNVLVTGGIAIHGRQLPDNQATLVRELRKVGVARGYADFWAANSLTYRSDLDLDVLPVECKGSKTVRRPVIVDAWRFDRRTARSFVLLGPGGATCPQASVVAQFGPPSREVPLSFGFRALVYPSDVGRRISEP